MFDLDLLRSFVSVADTGGFTSAGEKVHRTQSTVSQQIRRLEEAVGQPLFRRDRRRVQLTDAGETLLGYARRLLAIASEAHQALGGERPATVVRLGIPEDFAVTALTDVIAEFARRRPDVRLEVRCDLSVALRDGLAQGRHDAVLAKRDPGVAGGFGAWPERLVWIASRDHDLAGGVDPLPLITFLPGCLYRERAIRALEAAGRRWRVAYESPNLAGVQAAIAGGLGVALMERATVAPHHRVMGPDDGMPPVPSTEIALEHRPDAPEAATALCQVIAEFCNRRMSSASPMPQ
ncbi:LysR substrate-binding domain-containing protein [Zavarzinia compransoris]|uniref:LysR substrate-binding domain-containing protein n=1 Tax=Zavarzinia marina TaxID=2911065 RepID=UPI001F25C33F|nr:LysR substrate-binding domain-containing protein [Zavarzinia marina]MCF4164178.1 LysR substrate-binding domain-containing protein [Zavarzinia marina]